MNRELKFRVWDMLTPIMMYFTFADLLKNSVNLHYGSCDWELMQFTGLKDKNGKEIYEGDIVRQSSNLCIIKYCVGGFECQMLLELKNGGTIESSTYNFSFLSEKYCEVIGNIYENPELLNQ